MTRLRWLLTVLIAFSAATRCPSWATADEAKRPNVLFLFTDDLGWGDLGVLHQNESTHDRTHNTPNLDRMAAAGIQLRAHYCPAPVCAPSRSSLLTGVHQGHASIRDNQFDKMLADNHTLGTVMKTAGYATALVGKYGLQGDGSTPSEWAGYPTKRGFEEFYGYVRHRDGHVHYPADNWPLGNSEGHRSPKEVWHNDEEVSAGLKTCYTTDLFTAKAKDWIVRHQESSPDEPFFLYLGYDTPHAALQVPSVAYPDGGGLDGGVQWVGEPGRMINTATGEIDSYRHPDYVGRGWSDVEERFATLVRRIDDCVGDLLKTLEDLGIAENTLVVFTSDNGPHHESYLQGKNYDANSFQSYGKFDGTKRDSWEGGIRVPTLAWWPGAISAESVDHTPSQFHDWMATFAELGGVVAPARADGVSLLPILTGEGTRRPGTVYVEYFNGGSTKPYDDFAPRRHGAKRNQAQAVFVDRYKGVRVDIESHEDPFEIYDLTADPGERNDLAGTSPEVDELQQKMKDRVLQIRMPNESAPRPYDDEFVPPVDVSPRTNGLRLDQFTGDFPHVPNLDGVTPDASFITLSPPTGSAQSDRFDAGVLRGWLRIDEPGEYTFHVRSKHGAFLRIHEAAVVDGDFGVGEDDTVTGTIRLDQGYHPVRLTFRHTDQDRESPVRIQWSRGDGGAEPIPSDVWWCD